MIEQEFKERIIALVKDNPVKVWLTRSSGHRLEFLWSVGEPRTQPYETLARHGRYYIVAQNASESLKPALLSLFEEYCNSDEARQAQQPARQMRLMPTK